MRGVRRFTDLRAWQAGDTYKKAIYRIIDAGVYGKDWKRRVQIEESVSGPGGSHRADGIPAVAGGASKCAPGPGTPNRLAPRTAGQAQAEQGTANPERRTRNPERRTRNPEPQTRNPERRWTRNPEPNL